MRRAAVLLVCVGSALAVWGGTPVRAAAEPAAAAAPAASPSPDFVPWVPSESWPGGRQYDPRLEKTVAFWGAGMPLRDVFAGVKEQTGVEVGFWPADDLNTRVRANLYLNPNEPPSLREVMVQLAWVTECSFATAVEGEPAERVYYLLSTSIWQGVADRAEREIAEARQRGLDEYEQWVADSRTGVESQLAEYAKALELSRGQLIARYRGRDDFLLLSMLDPDRRAAVQFVCDLPEKDRQALLKGSSIRRDWLDLAPEVRASLQAAIGFDDHWLEDGVVQVTAGGVDNGQVGVGARVKVPGDEWNSIGVGQPVAIAHPLRSDEMSAATREALERALRGERIPPVDLMKAAMARRDEEWRRAEAARSTPQPAMPVPRSPVAVPGLSPDGAARLAAIILDLEEYRDYALWEIQELVSRASGMNTVSDCFWDVPRGVFYPDRPEPMSALNALIGACKPQQERAEMLEDSTPESVRSSLAWEWGDAGSSLRFRSERRGLWRASLLPQSAVEQLDAWLGPVIADALKPGQKRVTVHVPVDLRSVAAFVGGLDELPRKYGLGLTYGDPAAAPTQVQQAICEVLGRSFTGTLHQILGTFSDHQWRRVQDQGLVFGADLTPEQRQALAPYATPLPESAPEDFSMREVLLRVQPPAPAAEQATSVARDPGGDHYVVRFTVGDRVLREWREPTTLTVTVNLRDGQLAMGLPNASEGEAQEHGAVGGCA